MGHQLLTDSNHFSCISHSYLLELKTMKMKTTTTTTTTVPWCSFAWKPHGLLKQVPTSQAAMRGWGLPPHSVPASSLPGHWMFAFSLCHGFAHVCFIWNVHLFSQFNSVQFSRSVVSDSLWPHELQHARPPCPSPTPGVHSDSCPSSQWCHPAISSSVVPFSSCPQSLPVSESFPISQLFTWGGQSTGVSALASFLPKKSQGWSPSERTGWISLQSKGLSRVFSKTTVQKHQFFGAQLSSQSNCHIHTWPQEKP